MPIQVWSDQIWVVKLGEEPGLSEDLMTVRDQAEALPVSPHVVLDMSGVAQLNSSNLSQLLRLRKLMLVRNARMRLAALPDTVWAVFMTTGLEKVFEFTPDVPTALAALQMSR